MTQQVQTDDEIYEAANTRTAVRLILGGVALMALAGVVMWWQFGPSIFMNLVTTALGCF